MPNRPRRIERRLKSNAAQRHACAMDRLLASLGLIPPPLALPDPTDLQTVAELASWGVECSPEATDAQLANWSTSIARVRALSEDLQKEIA